MHISAAWHLKHAATATLTPTFGGKPSIVISGRQSLTPILRAPGHGFLV